MTIGIGAHVTQTYAVLDEGKTPKLGDVFNGSDNKCYKFVQYNVGAGSVAAVAGNVAYYYTAGGYATSQVTSDLSDSVNIGAGVLMSAPADGEYCWVQIKGAATLTTALTAGADGNALTPVGATDGTLNVSAAVTDAVCAYADGASAKKIVCCFPH